MPTHESHLTTSPDPSYSLRGDIDGVPHSFTLAFGENLIGSSRRAAVRLEAPSISRRHASLVVDADSISIRDLGSKNGTFVNGRPVTQSALEVGDEIRIGPIHLRLETMDPGDGVIGLELGDDLEEVSTASLGDRSTLLSRFGGAPQRRHFEIVDEFFERLGAGAGPDWVGALDSLARGLDAPGAALVLWRPEAVVLAAVGDAEDLPTAEWMASEAGDPALLPEGESPWIGAAASGLDEPLGLLLRVPFAGEKTTAPLLSTVLRIALHFHEARVAEVPESEARAAPSRGAGALDFPPGIVAGTSPAMLELYRQMAPLVRGDLPVLLRGETGVGKEHLAATLHRSSGRRGGPFVAINCAAIPAELLEAELFGIGKGVATGVQARRGKFAEADGGTLFLDEIGDMSADLQAKLLRALEEQEVHPLGLAPVKINVRTVAATNSDLAAKIEDGDFRADLYYRLAGVELRVPPLRDRQGDLPRLVAHFVRRFAAEAETRIRGLTVRALEELTAYAWPGNVRQLVHEVRRLVYLCPPGQAISSEMLSPAIREAQIEEASGLEEALGDDLGLEPRLEALERRLISEALRRTAGNQTRAAKLLGVSRNGLAYRLDRLGLDAASFAPA